MPKQEDQMRILIVSDKLYKRIVDTCNPAADVDILAISQPMDRSLFPSSNNMDLVSEDKAKEMLGRSTSTLWRYTSSHKLTKIKKLGRNYYIKEEIERLLQEYPVF